jgi:hypothetical protein
VLRASIPGVDALGPGSVPDHAKRVTTAHPRSPEERSRERAVRRHREREHHRPARRDHRRYVRHVVGSLFDIDDVETTESVLSEISNEVHATHTSVLAQVTVQSPGVIDAAMERLGGDVMRRSVVEVEQEIAAAQEAQRKAERDARKAGAHAQVEELKTKLHRAEARAAA